MNFYVVFQAKKLLLSWSLSKLVILSFYMSQNYTKFYKEVLGFLTFVGMVQKETTMSW